MLPQIKVISLAVVILLLSLISGRDVEAQSVCDGPNLGAGPNLSPAGLEICVQIVERGQPGGVVTTKINIREAFDPLVPLALLPGLVVGEYTINNMAITLNVVPGGGGIGIAMDGMVTRTGMGNNTLGIVVEAGWSSPFPASTGDLYVEGNSTGVSTVTVAAATGYGALVTNPTPAQGLNFRDFNNHVAVGSTRGAAAYVSEVRDIPIDAGAVAIQLLTFFNLTVRGTSVTIPSGAGISPLGGTPPIPGRAAALSKPHFECYSVVEHSPKEKYRDVKLEDQFDKVKAKIGKITRICTPVDKNKEGIPDPKLHLVCYEILNGHDPKRLVQISNQFGKNTMKVRKAQELCLPSTKKLMDEKPKQEKKPPEKKLKKE